VTKSRLLLISAILLLVAVTAVACGSDEMAMEDEAEMEEMAMDESGEMGDMAMGGAPDDLDTSTERMTDEGLFQVSVSTDLDPLPLNEIHSWTVHVETADGQPVEGAQIGVDGGMPEHNHGFPTTPEITEELGGGDYLLDGVKFSMSGWWELKLNIDDGDQSDQITFNLVLP
jgi:hypothetical protein